MFLRMVKFINAYNSPEELFDYANVIENKFKKDEVTEDEMRTLLSMCFQKAIMIAILERNGVNV